MSLIRVKLLEPLQNENKPVVVNDLPLIDEVVFKNVDLHIEQMSTESYWLGVTDAEGRNWHFCIGLSDTPPAGVELSCSDHPGEEAGQPFPPPELTSPPNFPEPGGAAPAA